MNDPAETPGALWRQLGCLVMALALAAAAVFVISWLGFQDNWLAVMAFTIVGGLIILWIVGKLFSDRRPAA